MQERRMIRWLAGIAMLTLSLGACNRAPEAEDQQTGSVTGEDVKAARADWPEAAVAQVDSGNAAYRADDLQKALRHYEAALEAAGGSESAKVTSYFGIYMVQVALGDTLAAQQAMAKAQQIAPGASLIHGTGMPLDSSAAPRTPDDSIHRRQGQ